HTSNWSEAIFVHVSPGEQWQLNAPPASPSAALREVQQALLRMCAARGDLFAVLSMPETDREASIIDYAVSFQPYSSAVNSLGGVEPYALSYGEAVALSYGALYYPWLVTASAQPERTLRRTPPDGAICGILARRAVERGAWVAPANEALQGVVA